jgi:flagellar basal-body rod protein FlgB
VKALISLEPLQVYHLNEASGTVVLDSSGNGLDGNTVNMEREMARLAENQLMYKASAQIVAKKFQALKSVINGGNR